MASAAGVASAFVSAPAELVMIQQQKDGRPLLTELQHIVKQHGLKHLYRGMVTPVAHLLHQQGVRCDCVGIAWSMEQRV